MAAESPAKPNVVLIITDDQGYGDLGVHGNTMIQTPQLDALARQSVRLTNFHVDPTCAETRSALMTGRYSCRTGVWHTVMGRSILGRSEYTLAQQFAHHGYRTAMFGKWHLGDNYPYRPHDRGFHETLYHGGGGVGQTPDFWGNDYFDDTYFRNGEPEPQKGYCTDVWFQEATRFIEKNKAEPFFCYLATNAPHSPYRVDPKYSEPYAKRGVPEPMAQFYGMIANIDENIGKLLGKLNELKLAENTIVIFMTDNGSAAGTPQSNAGKKKKKNARDGWAGFSAGMRGQKGSQYEGGHRVPCFIRWPNGKLPANRDVNLLAAHFDLFPTLTELCGMTFPSDIHFDGTSLAAYLRGDPELESLDRTLFVHSQRVDQPEMWRKCSVMTSRWRLIDGKELYDLPADSAQATDVAARFPDVVSNLKKAYEDWWKDVSSGPTSQGFDKYVSILLGADEANPTSLNCMDWHTEISQIPWSQSNIAGNPDVESNGFWAVEVARPGPYEFNLRSRPAGVPYQMKAGRARLKIGEVEGAADIMAGSDNARIVVTLPAGTFKLQTWLKEEGRNERGAFFVDVKRLNDPKTSAFELRDGDRVVLLGSTFIERLQGEGYFETALTAAFPDKNITFRNLGWSGDTVWGDSRGVFGERADGFKRLVDDTLAAKPTVLVIAYGHNEAFSDSAGLDEFRAGLMKLLNALSPSKARILLIAPPKALRVPEPLPSVDEYNRKLRLYCNAIKRIAAERKMECVDWFDVIYDLLPSESELTTDGLHWTDAAQWLAAPAMAMSFGAQLGSSIDLDVRNSEVQTQQCTVNNLAITNERISFELLPDVLPPAPLPLKNAESDPAKQTFRYASFVQLKIIGLEPGRYTVQCGDSEPIETTDTILHAGMNLQNAPGAEQATRLRQAIQSKNQMYFYRYRPQNETYLFLFRKHEQGNNAVEIPQFDPIIKAKEKEIAKLRVPKSFAVKIQRNVSG